MDNVEIILEKLEKDLNQAHQEYKKGNVPYSVVLEKSKEYRKALHEYVLK